MRGTNELLLDKPTELRKTAKASIEKLGTSTFVLTSDAIDRDNDRIDAAALKKAIKGHNKLITLWQHKHDQPVGFWSNLRTQESKVLGDLTLSSTNLGLMVQQLLNEDVPLAASIGFMGKGSFNDIGGIDFSEIELLECSIVSIPANPEAVRIAKSFGVDLASLVEDDNPPATSGNGTEPSERASEVIIKARKAIANANIVRRNHARSS